MFTHGKYRDIQRTSATRHVHMKKRREQTGTPPPPCLALTLPCPAMPTTTYYTMYAALPPCHTTLRWRRRRDGTLVLPPITQVAGRSSVRSIHPSIQPSAVPPTFLEGGPQAQGERSSNLLTGRLLCDGHHVANDWGRQRERERMWRWVGGVAAVVPQGKEWM